MAEYTPGQRRSEFIARARIAVRKGMTQAAFMRQAQDQGYSLRRQRMQAEWRNVTGVEIKADRFKFVRKDRTPTAAVIAQVDWSLSSEYMYKVKILSRIRPGEPITERFVNIMQDRPLTPAEVEGLTWEMIQTQSPKLQAQVVSITPWTVLQRVIL